MTITIECHQKDHTLDHNMLYNILKRAQEDLLSKEPLLQELILYVEVSQSYTSYNEAIKARHNLNPERTKLTFNVVHYWQHGPEELQQSIAKALAAFKQLYV